MALIRGLALTLRFLLELVAIVAVGWWGFALDAPAVVRVVVGLAAPLAVIVVWGAVAAPRARFDGPASVRLAVESVVWVAATAALVAVGSVTLAVAFVVLVVADRVALQATAAIQSQLEAGPEQGNQVERW